MVETAHHQLIIIIEDTNDSYDRFIAVNPVTRMETTLWYPSLEQLFNQIEPSDFADELDPDNLTRYTIHSYYIDNVLASYDEVLDNYPEYLL